jgi:hypothetical protein
MRISLSIETLQDAYDICLLVQDHCANVIAGSEKYENTKSDKEWHDKAKRFMTAFDRATKANPDRTKYRKDWIKNLENSLEKFNSAVGDLVEKFPPDEPTMKD